MAEFLDSTFPLSRRSLLSAALVAGTLGSTVHAAARQPIVETSHGRVRGQRREGVEVFSGIPYAATTDGANRYRPPQPVAPWSGVRDAVTFGASAPQMPYEGSFRTAFSKLEAIGEDCLSLNVFTPDARRGARRPVMVWLHGGGWRVGAGSSPGLRGVQLAREGGVVLITINHRLDVLGFLKIDDGDDRFADAGNLGVLDMIAALKWVRDNAENFGGDSGNVTIFGQSGGGAKVAAMLAAPAATGLFHKAIAMSCSGCLRITEPEEAERTSANVARKLGLPRLTGVALQQIPLDQLIKAGGGVHRPQHDGRTFDRHPYHPDAPASAAGIPLLAGKTAHETRIGLYSASPDNFQIDEAEALRRIVRYLRVEQAVGQRIMAQYRASFPTDTPADWLAAITSDYSYVRNTRRLADLQASHAPVYTYMFTRRSPVLNGILRASHETDVPFVFGTAAAAEEMVGAARDIAPLTRLMIHTWSRFAHSGRPGNALLPDWPQHSAGSSAGMMLDVQSRFGTLPGAEARTALDELPYHGYEMPSNYLRA